MRVEQFLIRIARRTPDKVALIAGDRRLTFAEIDKASDDLARALTRAGAMLARQATRLLLSRSPGVRPN